MLISQGDARREHWQHFAKRLELCRELQIKTLVVAGDINSPIGEQDYERLCVSLAEAAKLAGEYGVRLALEFQPRAVYPNNLQSAAALVEQIGNPNLGLCLDAMYFFTGPSKESDLAYLSLENLFHVQFSDVAGQPREFCADSDRVLPGDGDFPLEIIVKRLREINYAGCVSVELMNPSIWQIPARQFGEVAMTAVRKVLGLASM